MSYFYDVEQGVFLVNGIHTIPDTAIKVSETDYQLLIDGRAKGKEIIVLNGTLTLTSVKPSPYHHWDGQKWAISAEKKTALLTQRKAELLGAIATKTDQLKAGYLSGYSQAEIDSFYRQEREARNELPLMLLTEIFEGRNDLTDVEQLKAKVIEKADLFAIIMGKTFAVKQGFEVKIEQAQTLDELDQINKEIEQWQSI